MSVCSLLKEKEQVETNQIKPNSAVEELLKKGQGSASESECTNDKAEVKKAIEANNLCYNYETGFHYMK